MGFHATFGLRKDHVIEYHLNCDPSLRVAVDEIFEQSHLSNPNSQYIHPEAYENKEKKDTS